MKSSNDDITCMDHLHETRRAFWRNAHAVVIKAVLKKLKRVDAIGEYEHGL